MSWNDVGKLIEVKGKMDAKQYCEILDEGLVKSFEKLDMEEGERYFQQDNDPKHTSKIHWPAQFPVGFPVIIEDIWKAIVGLYWEMPSTIGFDFQ